MSELELARFWESITVTAYSRTNHESSIRDPLIRYIHRIIACTIAGRKSGNDKCNTVDLFCLYCILGHGEANLATVLLTGFKKGHRLGAQLELGTYITRIAAYLGVFDRYPIEHLTPGPVTRVLM